MKIVTITSSGRKNGNTERLVSMLENQMSQIAKEKGIPLEVSHVALFGEGIWLCQGCRMCFNKGEEYCPLKDATLVIRDRLRQADGLVLASPVYVEDVSGTMKNWIDRMAFVCHRPEFFGKCAMVISTSGGSATSRSLHTMKNALSAWGFQVVSMRNYLMGARMEEAELARRFADETRKAAALLLDSIRTARAQSPTLFSLITFRIQQRYYRTSRSAGTTDRAYWEKNGWLARKASYYVPVHTGPIKLLTAKMIGRIMSRFFV